MNNIFIVKIKGYVMKDIKDKVQVEDKYMNTKVEVKVKNSGSYLFSTSA